MLQQNESEEKKNMSCLATEAVHGILTPSPSPSASTRPLHRQGDDGRPIAERPVSLITDRRIEGVRDSSG